MADSSIVFQTLFNGIMLGLLLVIFALGLSLVFGIMRILNFAHGELYMLGGFGMWGLFAQHHVNYFLALVLTMLAVALIGIVIERFIFKPFRGKLLSGLIASLALILILQTSVFLSFGIQDKAIPTAPGFGGVISVFGVIFSRERFFIIIITAVLVLLLHLFLKRTKPGKAMRATAQEPDGAALLGIKVDNTCSIAMAIGCALAAAAGALVGTMFYVNAFIGEPWLMKGLAVVVLGGLGSIPGTMLGGFIIGMVESFGTTYIGGDYSFMMIFLVLLIVLLVRPRGLFGLPFRQ